MATASGWQTKQLAVTRLLLDSKNPRLGGDAGSQSPRELIQFLFEHDKAMDVARSIAVRGYFPNEPLLAVHENGRHIVIEGNRRLAALKALLQPGLLTGAREKQLEKLRRSADLSQFERVPVVVAPSRRATDQQVSGRHVGTPVLPWQAENRAAFILQKLADGYSPRELSNELAFTASDIQAAKQTRAIVEMARALELPSDVRRKLSNPRAPIFSTIGRVFDSTVGREFLGVDTDAEHGFRGKTTREAFSHAFGKIVEDIAQGRQSSRTLNTNDEIRSYFRSWDPNDLPKDKKGSFIPSDLISKAPDTSPREQPPEQTRRAPQAQPSKTILPKSFRVSVENERLLDLHRELTSLEREKFPNAGAILLRVFLELSIIDYLKRTGRLAKLIETLGGKGKLPYDNPSMKQLVPEISSIVKAKLPRGQANEVIKAIQYNDAAPFTVSDLHTFVHQVAALPTPRDIVQFWMRTEPLFELMLTHSLDGAEE